MVVSSLPAWPLLLGLFFRGVLGQTQDTFIDTVFQDLHGNTNVVHEHGNLRSLQWQSGSLEQWMAARHEQVDEARPLDFISEVFTIPEYAGSLVPITTYGILISGTLSAGSSLDCTLSCEDASGAKDMVLIDYDTGEIFGFVPGTSCPLSVSRTLTENTNVMVLAWSRTGALERAAISCYCSTSTVSTSCNVPIPETPRCGFATLRNSFFGW